MLIPHVPKMDRLERPVEVMFGDAGWTWRPRGGPRAHASRPIHQGDGVPRKHLVRLVTWCLMDTRMELGVEQFEIVLTNQLEATSIAGWRAGDCGSIGAVLRLPLLRRACQD